MLRELVDQDMLACCYRGAHNRTVEAIVLAPDQAPDEDSKIYMLRELEIVVDKRWHADHEWLSGLLMKHTTLRALNGLHEWPTPPLIESDVRGIPICPSPCL